MTFLCVLLGLATAGLIVYAVSSRASWESERAQLQSKVEDLRSQVDLAKRLFDRQGRQYLEICRRMLDGTPEQREYLREAMDAQDARNDAEGGIIDPPLFP